MALTARERGEFRALVESTVDAAIGRLTDPASAGSVTKDEQLAALQAHVYNLDIENRLLRLALYGQKERAAIARIAEHVGVDVDLDIPGDNEPKE